MRINNFYAIFFCALFCSVMCHGNKIRIFPPFRGRSAGPTTVIDTSKIQVYYAFCASDIRNEDTYRDLFCLEIGRRTLKFHSHFLEKAEMQVRDWKRTNANESASPRVEPKGRYDKGWSEYQYSQWYISEVGCPICCANTLHISLI